jgi:hypothetical protein
MGGSRWSDDDYNLSVGSKMRSHGTSFTYDDDIKKGKTAAAVAPKPDPAAMKSNPLDPNGTKVRESRDSATHPNSKGVIVGLDVTGSMGEQSVIVHSSLARLMGLLTRKSYLADAQVLYAAIGDVDFDKAPIQLGQFEAGVEMEDDLSKFWIEGGGGGQTPPIESYDLLMYFGARHTAMDCLEKRGEKGYFFVIGDEMPFPVISKAHIKQVFGIDIEADIKVETIVEELKEKFNCFFILPTHASHGHDTRMINRWKELFGPQNVLLIEDAKGTPELIATQIGLCEGTTDVDSAVADMKDVGTSASTALVVAGAVSKAYAGGALTKVPPGTLIPSSGDSGAKRI